jgi:hypothetical protein
MARHHLREKEPGWKPGIVINGIGAVVSLVVALVIAYTKFLHGAWLIMVFVPAMVFFLIRLARQYGTEAHHLDVDVPAAVHAPVMRRLAVLVFVDRLDLATARAIQFGRSLHPDELRAVHFVVDHQRADDLSAMWREHGLANIPLDLVGCPDRRLNRAAMTTVARTLSDMRTEVCVVIAERRYGGFWRRILHDQTADALARDIERIPHANVTTVPFHLGREDALRETLPVGKASAQSPRAAQPSTDADRPAPTPPRPPTAYGTVPIGDVVWRSRVRVSGQISGLRVQPLAGVGSLECTLSDDTGGITLVFLGRRTVAGIDIGSRITAEGIATDHHGRLAIMNPVYRLH